MAFPSLYGLSEDDVRANVPAENLDTNALGRVWEECAEVVEDRANGVSFYQRRGAALRLLALAAQYEAIRSLDIGDVRTEFNNFARERENLLRTLDDRKLKIIG